MTQRIRFTLMAMVLLLWQTSPAQASDKVLKALMDQYWVYRLEESPTLATRVGLRDFNIERKSAPSRL